MKFKYKIAIEEAYQDPKNKNILSEKHKTTKTIPKSMQNILIFIEPNDQAFITPEKIAHLYMNRFFIDEDAGFELLGVCELSKSSDRIGFMQHKGMNIRKSTPTMFKIRHQHQ